MVKLVLDIKNQSNYFYLKSKGELVYNRKSRLKEINI